MILYLAGLYKPRTLYRISDQRDLILSNAIKRKEYLKALDTDINLRVAMLPHANQSFHMISKGLDKDLNKYISLSLHDVVGIKKEEERIKAAKARGYTGDSDVDQMLKLHKILSKLGYIKD